jgi:hypothetical protein
MWAITQQRVITACCVEAGRLNFLAPPPSVERAAEMWNRASAAASVVSTILRSFAASSRATNDP